MRILRILGGLALLAACAGAAGGQSVGLKGGWARPTVGGGDAGGWEAINTIAGGGFATLALSPVFAAEVDALYVGKGSEKADLKLRAGYFEIPLLARLTLPLRAHVAPEVIVGPYLAFNTSCTLEASGSAGPTSATCADAGEPIKKTDLGLVFGGGIGIPLPAGLTGLVEARYDLGLTRTDDTPPARDVKNRTFMLFAGASIAVGPRGRIAAVRSR